MLENLASWYRRKFRIVETWATLPFAVFFFVLSLVSGWISFKEIIADPAEVDILLWSLVPFLFFGGWVLIAFTRPDRLVELFSFGPGRVVTPADRRKSQYTLIITAITFLLASFGTFDAMAWFYLETEWARDGLRLASAGLLAMIGGAVVFWLNKRFPGSAARTAFVAYLFLIFGLTDTPTETTAGRSLVFQIIPVILAGFTVTPGMSFVFAFASIALMSVRSATVGAGFNSIAYLGILLVAFVAWLVASRLEYAITQYEAMNIVLEKRVAERTKQLQEANKFKSQFLAQISHELQSPIIAFTLFLRKVKPVTELKEAGALEDEALRLLEMTKSISRVSKLELEILEQRLQLEGIDLIEIIDQQISVHHLEAEENGITLKFDQSGLSSPVIGNRNYLARMFDNLIRNAIKYSQPGAEVTLSVHPDGDMVRVRIQDSGIGIPAAELSAIFDRFSRASNVGSRPGTGLGLSMVKNMVEAMEGEITVESVEGVGSTFTVRLPAA